MCSNPNLQACDVSMHMHTCMQKHTLSVCLCLSLFVSVCDLFVNVARTCIHTLTNVRNGCTHCMHPCKCTKKCAPFLSHSLLSFRLVSLSCKNTLIGPFKLPDPPHSVSICAKHTHMLTHMNTHASLTCRHLMYDAHARMHTKPHIICMSVSLSVCICLFAVRQIRTHLHSHTHGRTQWIHALHACMQVHENIRSLFF